MRRDIREDEAVRPVDSLELPDAGSTLGLSRGLLAVCLAILSTVAAPTFGGGSDNGPEVPGALRMPSEQDLRIEIRGETVSLRARDIPLVEILDRLAEDLSFQVQVTGEIDQRVTWSGDNLSPYEIIEKLLDRRSYVIIHAKPKIAFGKAAIEKLRVFGITGRRQAAAPESQSQLALREQQWQDRKVRLERLEQLGREQTAEASWELAALLSDDPDTRIRHAAAIALGKYRDPESAEALRIALQDSSHWVRKEALRSLAGIGGPESLEAVKVVFETDTDEQIRDLAARILEALGRKVQR